MSDTVRRKTDFFDKKSSHVNCGRKNPQSVMAAVCCLNRYLLFKEIRNLDRLFLHFAGRCPWCIQSRSCTSNRTLQACTTVCRRSCSQINFRAVAGMIGMKLPAEPYRNAVRLPVLILILKMSHLHYVIP